MKGGDPAFKLFGREIPMPQSQIHAGDSTIVEIETSQANTCQSITVENDTEECRTSLKSNGIRMNCIVKDEQVETNGTNQEKVFKKPDKILPCPRCNSFDTKFCYFNNYNVNQPRHFCKNCQRYWTAGGTMRNVPIGAGRRKNKHLASQYRQIIIASSGGVPVTRIETPDSTTQQLLSPGETTTAMGNGTVLKFGTEAPLCESMETVLSLGDQKRCVETSTVSSGEIREEPSLCGSSMTPCGMPGNVMQKERIGSAGPNELNTKHPTQCYPVSPCIFPWNTGLSNVASMATGQGSSEHIGAPNGTTSNTVQWCPAPMVAVPGFCPSNIQLQFVPAYWGCIPLWAPGGGNVSISNSSGCLSPSSSTSNSCGSGNGLLTLGKHYREANVVEEEQSEKCILVPKTLRIDNPNEASRSPIWATLGIKPGQKDPLRGGKIFNAFESKAEGKDHVSDGSYILEANPAALSRSQTFQEST